MLLPVVPWLRRVSRCGARRSTCPANRAAIRKRSARGASRTYRSARTPAAVWADTGDPAARQSASAINATFTILFLHRMREPSSERSLAYRASWPATGATILVDEQGSSPLGNNPRPNPLPLQPRATWLRITPIRGQARRCTQLRRRAARPLCSLLYRSFILTGRAPAFFRAQNSHAPLNRRGRPPQRKPYGGRRLARSQQSEQPPVVVIRPFDITFPGQSGTLVNNKRGSGSLRSPRQSQGYVRPSIRSLRKRAGSFSVPVSRADRLGTFRSRRAFNSSCCCVELLYA